MTESVCHHVSAEHGVMAALTTLHISCTTKQLVSMSTEFTLCRTRLWPHDLAFSDTTKPLVKLQYCLTSGVNKSDMVFSSFLSHFRPFLFCVRLIHFF
jgi:hypothetical protein